MKHKTKIEYKISGKVLRKFLETTFGPEFDEEDCSRWTCKTKKVGADSFYEVAAPRLITKDEIMKLRNASLPKPPLIPKKSKTKTI